MDRQSISKTLRLLSYLVFPDALVFIEVVGVTNPCQGVGCMGNMFGVMATLVVVPLLAAALNGASCLLVRKNVSILRSIELAVFAVPALCALVGVALFVAERFF